VRLNEYGDIAAAHDLAREGLEIARRAGMREGLEQFFGTISWTSWMLGRWDDSLAARDELMATGGYGSFYRTGATIFTAVPRGDLAQARAALAEHAVWAGSDDAQLRSGYRYLEAVVLQGEGRSVEAAAVARDAAEIFAGVSGSRHPWLFDVELTALADAGDAERLADALEAVDSLSPLERPPIIRAVAAYGHGRLGALRNDVDDAVSWFIQASDLFASMQLPYPRAVTLVHHAETLAEAGRFEEASPLLDEARKVFEGLAAVVWLQRISRVAQIVPA
jgi:tetratricopeptide (TPR) repeat protein